MSFRVNLMNIGYHKKEKKSMCQRENANSIYFSTDKFLFMHASVYGSTRFILRLCRNAPLNKNLSFSPHFPIQTT